MCVYITCVWTTVADVSEINVLKSCGKFLEWPCYALLPHYSAWENTVASKEMLHNTLLYYSRAVASLFLCSEPLKSICICTASLWSSLIDPCLNKRASQNTVAALKFQQKFRPLYEPEIWLWLPDTRGGKDVLVVWSYLEQQDPPWALWVQLHESDLSSREGKGGMMKGEVAGRRDRGVCQGPGSLPLLFDLAGWREHRRHQETCRALFPAIMCSTPHNKAVKTSCWKYVVLGSDMCCLASCTQCCKNVLRFSPLVLLPWHVSDF